MKRILGLLLVLMLMVTGAAQAGMSRVDVKPFDECEQSNGSIIAPSNTWAWGYATTQYGLQIEYMTWGDQTFWKIANQGSFAAANAVYYNRAAVSYRLYQMGNSGPTSAEPGAQSVHNALRNDASPSVPRVVAQRAKMAAKSAISSIYYSIIGGCGGDD